MTVNVRPWKDEGGRYQVEVYFRWPDLTACRDRRVITATSAASARRWGDLREAELREAGRVARLPKPSKPPTVSAFALTFIADLRARLRKAADIHNVERELHSHVLPFVGDLHLDEVTNAQISLLRRRWTEGGYSTFHGRIAKPTSNKRTHNLRLCQISRLLHAAVDFGVLQKMPCRIVRSKVDDDKAAMFYDDATLGRLLVAAAELDVRYHALVLLGCDAGLRRGEIIALRRSDIDFAAGRIYVRRSIWHNGAIPFESETKGGKERWLPMTSRLANVLQSVPEIGPRVLCKDGGKELLPNDVAYWMARVESQAGLPVTGRVHVLRHTFITRLAMAGVPARVIQALARHAQLIQTERYMHLAPHATEKGIAAIENAADPRAAR